jgi:glycosyltransferase involved in cell wall biosynthesis
LPERRYRVLAIGSHPVQYMAPLLRRMAQHPRMDFSVAYCTLRGAEAAHDPEFGATVKWDIPLLDGYKWVQVPNRGKGSETFFGLHNPGLWKLIREGKFDAILSYTGYRNASFWISLIAARLSGAAFIFGTDASSLEPRDGRRWKIALKKIFWPRLFGLADQVITPSAAGAEMMRSLGLPEEKISLTPFVADNDWWTEQAKSVNREETRHSWGVGPDELVVLFCAKLQPWKRPLDLLHAFVAVNVPNSTLAFAGDGPLAGELKTQAEASGLGSRIRFLGMTNQSKLPAVYTAADLFVLPSDYDPCPVVVCEAMLCGLPVVLSDRIRGRFDLVVPGRTGEIFPCGDVESLAATLRKLLSDRDGLARLATNAQARMGTWSPRENIEATFEAVQRAVARTKSSLTRQ